MATKNQNLPQPPPAVSGQQPKSRRPYSAPRVDTFPLFERMALGCDISLKGSGADDVS